MTIMIIVILLWLVIGWFAVTYWHQKYEDTSVVWWLMILGPIVFIILLRVKDIYKKNDIEDRENKGI